MKAQTLDALVLIDIQNDYFPGGKMELHQPGAAAEQAAELARAFRAHGKPVVHIRHEAARPEAGFFLPGTHGAETHPAVAPQPGEPVLTKHFPNSFRDTGLAEVLESLGARSLLVAGMMTNMCVDATVRAGFDLGYTMAVASDACAARPLELDGRKVDPRDVHAAFLAALALVYATVRPAQAWLAELEG